MLHIADAVTHQIHVVRTTEINYGTAPNRNRVKSQVLIEVHAASVNFVDVAVARERARPGEVLGMDAAGVDVAAAADGSGPPVGARVVTFGWDRGAWAQLRAVDTIEHAVLPNRWISAQQARYLRRASRRCARYGGSALCWAAES